MMSVTTDEVRSLRALVAQRDLRIAELEARVASGDAALGFVAQNPAVLCAAAREGRSEVVGRLKHWLPERWRTLEGRLDSDEAGGSLRCSNGFLNGCGDT